MVENPAKAMKTGKNGKNRSMVEKSQMRCKVIGNIPISATCPVVLFRN